MKVLLFAVLVGLHVVFSQASYGFYLELARRPVADRPPVLVALTEAALRVAWQPLLVPAGHGRWPGLRDFLDPHRPLAVWINSTAAVGVAFLAWGLAVWSFRLYRRLSQPPLGP